jgi:alpha-tubulin suppressor-like RCC1 family protein
VQIGALTNWLSISAGIYNMIALKTDGTLWSWGNNANGQLGLGNRTYYSSPKQIGALTTWYKIANGWGGNSGFCSAIKTDGTLWGWGYNGYGQVGDSTLINRSSPVQIPGTNWSQISNGHQTNFGRKSVP